MYLGDPDDFTRFSVAVEGDGDLARVVDEAGLGRLRPDGEHLVVDPVALRARWRGPPPPLRGTRAFPAWSRTPPGRAGWRTTAASSPISSDATRSAESPAGARAATSGEWDRAGPNCRVGARRSYP